ncbi:U11/U12 small nuclear ribonucleoprotein 25 kDa protein isoform X1 [Gossypium hirsutum]|uniref:U11/U12 small nuclear ribonucleoprotein 25 kDa protein isoform X1 n=2 Tax=Gossypium TaxID=3633 RepID=A0ABM3BH56_GOSHI|nr:U11/U12 small nuclear ribonucleoprotein 25 kDa protein-like isoform X1 [Gossypium hirsutum]XP_040966399.1 U11/U12 small nuclear ribonucleoprotein 25 kDa protein-like isoform X1 [Gossypium hirsutum]XP_040966400.1 U11/U12 small nuclear ribonucleoprotein 25 kDa protein-like isoform X1 [Gossypium hirsutum]XP_040966401.1 U11/U12 small nuclear ribonucleoprotein 25 kDa protein-like isoform X1 [Gossypium hirsutum]XP_040966402.1 U11/U12 small nuclear ribonucleoprotein 25 kDa protein-like isoform X1 [
MESGAKEEGKVLGYNSKKVKKVAILSTLAALLDDPILADVPKKPSLSDVDILINLELGSAMCISIFKLDGTSFGTLHMLTHTRTARQAFSHIEFVFEIKVSTYLDWFSLEFEDVAVMNSATVKDLKLAIKKKVIELEQSKMGHRHISWRHVWANFCLAHHSGKLLDDDAALHDFGVRNNYQVHFLPYVVSKGSGRHSKRRKHRFFHGLSKLS